MCWVCRLTEDDYLAALKQHDALEPESVTADDISTDTITTATVAVGDSFAVEALALAEALQVDLPADSTTNATVAVGGSFAGELELEGDEDWIAVDLVAGQAYAFTLITSYYTGYLELFDAGSTSLSSVYDDFGVGAVILFTAEESGTYFLSASDFFQTAGSYTLSAVESDDIANSTSTMATIAVGESQSSTFDAPYDSDWFRATLTAGTTYTLSLAYDDPFAYHSIILYDADGERIFLPPFSQGGVTFDYAPSTSGTFYIAAEGEDFAVGDYTLSLDAGIPPGDVIPGDTTTSESISVGGSVSGLLQTSDDRDWYSVSMTAGSTYEISLDGQGDLDAFLRIRDDQGSLLSTNNNSGPGTDALITFTATQNGTHYLSAGSSQNASAGEFVLSIDEVNADPDTEIPDDTSTTATISVDGSAVTGEYETAGDRDWYRVTLEAGKTYEVALDGITASDPYLRVYDSNGSQIDRNDDGGPGFDSLLTFTAEEAGTYYLSAGTYSDRGTGTYSLSISETEPPPPASPLDAIDWGTQFTFDEGEARVIDVYFYRAGQSLDGETSVAWNAYERGQAMDALDSFSSYVDLQFNRVSNEADAEFRLMLADMGSSSLGFMYPPEEGGDKSGLGAFSVTGAGWARTEGGGLEEGGLSYAVLLHEFGHGLGLAHPHDSGGTSSIMEGVSGSSSHGDFDLNQGVFTTMSYNDGWDAERPASDTSFGHQMTISPLDIALLQEKYGANTSHNNSNTLYSLDAINGAGTGFEAIWDTGGTDTIRHSTSEASTIDLRAATLEQEAGGGGFISAVDGIIGGFTIANGVVIEKATGGTGADTIIGNDADNTLSGRGGNDDITGGGGADAINGGGGGQDIARYADARSAYTLFENEDGSISVTGGSDGGDTLTGIEQIAFSDGTHDLEDVLTDPPVVSTVTIVASSIVVGCDWLSSPEEELGDTISFAVTPSVAGCDWLDLG